MAENSHETNCSKAGKAGVYLLYNMVLFLLALPLLPCYLLAALLRGKTRQGIPERFGYYGPGRLSPLAGKKVLWIHAVSVGETRAAISLVKALKKRFPDYALAITNVTETGHKVTRAIPEVDLALFFPYDFPWTIERVYRQLKPELVVIVETEIWPNFIRTARLHNIPIILVNGRISDRSFPRYRRLRFFLEPVLNQFSLLCMQSPLDSERVLALGALPNRVKTTHNLKFDMGTGELGQIEASRIKQKFFLPVDAKIWVAASTHAGEEDQVIEVYQRLLQRDASLLLILVPRHPERCRAVGELLAARKIPFVLRSELQKNSAPLTPGMILLVDSIGEVLSFYSVSNLIFVGGSLVPVGGHNVLEASLLKKPVVFGPHMHNFKEISRLLIEAGGGLSVSDKDDLYKRAAYLLANPEYGREMGERGYGLLKEHRGATEQTLQAIVQILEDR